MSIRSYFFMDLNHNYFMNLALEEAKKGFIKSEVPVGAILIDLYGRQIASAHNLTITNNDPTSHAEIIALRKASKFTGNYRLNNTVLYVTIEPCIMCMGALVHARVQQVVFGAKDPKWGACGSLYNFADDSRLNHKIKLTRGIMEKKCSNLMKNFFKLKRKHVATK